MTLAHRHGLKRIGRSNRIWCVKSRHGGIQDGGLQGRAGSNGPGGPGVRAHASSPAPTRVLRKRDPKGRSGVPARRAKDETLDWEDTSNQRMDASQGQTLQLHCIHVSMVATTTP